MVVRSILPSVEDAKVVEEQGADVYVATGFDEGGTLPPRIIGSFSNNIPMIQWPQYCHQAYEGLNPNPYHDLIHRQPA